MSQSQQKHVCIIGGGVAGLATAVFLDAAGFRVTLLERRAFVGGRTYAFQDRKMGTWVDNGQHLLMGAYHETFRFLEMIGAKRHLIIQKKTRIPLVTADGQKWEFNLPNLPQTLALGYAVAASPVFGWRDCLGLVKLNQALKRFLINSNAAEFDVSAKDWLVSYQQSEKSLNNFWEILGAATLNETLEVASSRSLAAVLAMGFLASKEDSRLVIPKEHLSDLFGKPAVTYLEMRGHQILRRASALSLHILDNRVQAIETDTGERIKADLYVSAVPFRQLLRLIPQGFSENLEYFKNLTGLKTSPIVSVNLWFDREVTPEHLMGFSGNGLHWIFNRNRILDVTHPPYHYVGVVSAAHHLLDTPGDTIRDQVLEQLARALPLVKEAKLLHSLVNKERDATLSPTVASEHLRPDQQSPFDNLFVVGDWTKTGLPATIESAVKSASLAVERIKGL